MAYKYWWTLKLDRVKFGTHGSEIVDFDITPYGIIPPDGVPLWVWITSAVLVGSGIVYLITKK